MAFLQDSKLTGIISFGADFLLAHLASSEQQLHKIHVAFEARLGYLVLGKRDKCDRLFSVHRGTNSYCLSGQSSSEPGRVKAGPSAGLLLVVVTKITTDQTLAWNGPDLKWSLRAVHNRASEILGRAHTPTRDQQEFYSRKVSLLTFQSS